MRPILLLSALLLLCTSCRQAADPVYKPLRQAIAPVIKCMLQDKNGNMWFGTLGKGLCKYDGKKLTYYTTGQGLGNNNVQALLEDKAGRLWLGTKGCGLSCIDAGMVRRIDPPEPAQAEASENSCVRTGGVWGLYEDKQGNILSATQNGVFCYDGHSLSQLGNYLIPASGGFFGKMPFQINCIYEDKAEKIWFGTDGGGVCCFDGKAFRYFNTDNGLCDDNVTAITGDKAGNIWIGSVRGGISKFDGQRFTTFIRKSKEIDNDILSILEDSTGRVWLGTYHGVYCFDGKDISPFAPAQAHLDYPVWSIVQDRAGTLWFATDGAGVYTYDGKRFDSFDPGTPG